MNERKHTVGVQKKSEDGKIPTDDWLVYEWEMLHDLGFEVADSFTMSLNHEQPYYGVERKLQLSVHRMKNLWILSGILNDSPLKTVSFKSYVDLLNVIHVIFKRF